jgi:hypothetical protein
MDQPPLQRLGDFENLRELGRGGMGVVFEARQLSLNRKVALKVLSGGLGLTGKGVQRFQREAEAAAKLHQSNIVPVYATGAEGDTHYYAMELIDGPSLDRVIRQMRQTRDAQSSGSPASASENVLPTAITGPYVAESSPQANSAALLSTSSLSSDGQYFDTVARMIADVADALEHAHKSGVIHRDMKPSNLLLSPDGRLSINDFGLARLLEQPEMTMTGEFVGTPAYLSPEQITSGRVPLDHRTDIYSLGATLYELLTLRPPFTGERRDQVLAWSAFQGSNLKQMQEATEDITAAKRLMQTEDCTLALENSLTVHQLAAILYQQGGKSADAEAALCTAPADAEALARFPDRQRAANFCGTFLADDGKQEDAATGGWKPRPGPGPLPGVPRRACSIRYQLSLGPRFPGPDEERSQLAAGDSAEAVRESGCPAVVRLRRYDEHSPSWADSAASRRMLGRGRAAGQDPGRLRDPARAGPRRDGRCL